MYILTKKQYLHSNMFLLIPYDRPGSECYHQNLHSNMFLLILYRKQVLILSCLHLHSNMFLLILAWCYESMLVFNIYIPICFY